MKIKEKDQKNSLHNLFDIADSTKKETNLSKIIAYLVSKHSTVFEKFLEAIDIKLESNPEDCLKAAVIEIEKSFKKEKSGQYKRGRTDIEIEFTDNDKKYYIIVECKVSSNKATSEQYINYKHLLLKKNAHQKYFVFLTHQSGINLLEKNTDIKVIDLNWRKLISDFSSIEDSSSTEDSSPTESEAELKDFLSYYERRYGMSNQKEILIQDLSEPDQLNKYEYGLYRRDKVKGSPLYFAPYFTNKTDNPGLGSISKILGIITTQNIEWQNVKPTCERFLENASYKKDEKKRHLERWKRAVNSKDDTLKKDTEATYYFLDDMTPIQPRLKKGGKLVSQIPKNYTITFAELLIEYNKAIKPSE